MANTAAQTPSLQGDRPAAASAQGLADRIALTAIAVERSPTPMVITDPRQPGNPIVLANKAFLDLTRYSAEEVLGQASTFLHGARTSPAAVSAIANAVAAGRDIEIDILNYRKDGSAFWNRLRLSPVRDDAGSLQYIFGSHQDVTELRKVRSLQASEQRLLKEVDHRARNVLAVVAGIVRLSRSEEPARYAAAIQQRVQVLAGAHALLAERGWQDVGFEQIIRQQIDLTSSRRVAAQGPDLMVSAIAVQPVALVIHELLDNARTHGALSVPDGHVDLTWNHGPDFGAFELEWREVGGPPLPPEPRRGFGRAMVEGMIEKQLRGSVDVAWIDDGLTIMIKAPGTFESIAA